MSEHAHPVAWQTPQPLWARFGAAAADQPRPAILRFASDDFMDQVLGTLARDPSRLDALLARPETWRSPMGEPAGLMEHTPVPRQAQAAVRRTLAQVLKGAVAPTAPDAELTEQARVRRRPLKLYHPAHQRFYLVGASLVCGVPGLPERAVVQGGAEQVGFVLRRLLPEPAGSTDPEALREFAYVKDDAGARWRRVGAGEAEGRLAAGEERLPVFPLPFRDDGERPRTMWAGLVPVGRREEYVAAGVDRTVAAGFAEGQLLAVRGAPPAAPRSSKQARMAAFQVEVAEPWKNLVRSSHRASASLVAGSIAGESEGTGPKRGRVFDHNLQQQNTSWLILLDFADYLAAYLPEVWTVVENDGAGAGSLPDPKRAVAEWLGTAAMPAGLVTALKPADAAAEVRPPMPSLRAALKAVRAPGVREKLEATEISYTRDPASLGSATDWPAFHFVLAGLDTGGSVAGPFSALDALAAPGADEAEADPPAPPAGAAEAAAAKLDRLTALVVRALEGRPEPDAPPLPFALQLRDALKANAGDAGWFVVRFVYARTDCGPLHPPVLSAPTQRFQLASFFDPDAPARPVRITLPLDTSPAGLRKFNRNTAFVMSDMLCGQIQRAKGLGLIDLVLSVLPWPLHKDLDVGSGGPCRSGEINIGMICSLSIPIITICALIVLIIMVSLLDLIFRWLPFFIFCFPLPGFSGKKATS